MLLILLFTGCLGGDGAGDPGAGDSGAGDAGAGDAGAGDSGAGDSGGPAAAEPIYLEGGRVWDIAFLSGGGLRAVGEIVGTDTFGRGQDTQTSLADYQGDGFVAAWDDTAFAWVMQLPQNADDDAAVQVISAMPGPDGSLLFAGTVDGSTTLPSRGGEEQGLVLEGDRGAWVARASESGELELSRLLFEAGLFDDPSAAGKGRGPIELADAAALPDGGVVVVGTFTGRIEHGPTGFTLDAAGTQRDHCGGPCPDVFVSKTDASLAPQWTVALGGTAYDRGRSIAVGQDGAIYVLMQFLDGVDLGDVHLDAIGGTNDHDFDLALVRLEPDGSVGWARQLGNEEREYGCGVTIGPDGSVQVAGSHAAESLLINVGQPDEYLLVHGDDPRQRGFLARWDTDGALLDATLLGARQASGYGSSRCLDIDDAGRTLVVMRHDGTTTHGSVTLDPGIGLAMLDADLAPLDAWWIGELRDSVKGVTVHGDRAWIAADTLHPDDGSDVGMVGWPLP